MSKHTPGPWLLRDQTHIYSERLDLLAVAQHGQQAAANARLIASAPELLEALQAVRRACPMLGDGLGEQVDAAIASATGSEA